MSLHVESIVNVLRWYRGADGFNAHAPFDVAGVMLQLTRDSVFVLALNGRMSRQYRSELRDWCAAHGITTVLADRRGRLRSWTRESEMRRGWVPAE